MHMTQIINLFHEFGIKSETDWGKLIIYTDSRYRLSSVQGRIYRGISVAHIATKYRLAVVMV